MKKFFLLGLLFFIFENSCSAETIAPIDVTNVTIIELQEYLEKGVITSEELVQIYLERITHYNDTYNAIQSINTNVLEEARLLDEERASGHVRGLMHGIPMVVKSNIDVKGLATTAGAKALKDNIASTDAEVVRRLKESGALILGNTNMSEFAFMGVNSYSSYGNVINALNPLYSSYGSSGGSAVAVALSFAPVALGTDTNSSVRMPAAAQGLVGYRPTFNTFSTKGIIPYDVTRDTVGILAKHVSDVELVSQVMTDNFEDNSFKKDSWTIGVITDFAIGSDSNSLLQNKQTATFIQEMMKEQFKKLEEAGAKIVWIDSFYNSNFQYIANQTMAGSTFCDGFNDYIKGHFGPIQSFQQLANSSGRVYGLSDYLSSCGEGFSWIQSLEKTKAPYLEKVQSIFNEHDLDAIVYPNFKKVLGEKGVTTASGSPSAILSSVLGMPAITVPMGQTSDQLSYGMEFLSLKEQDKLLMKIVYDYENLRNTAINYGTESLYEIPESVQKLVQIYLKEENLSEWKNKVKDYWKNYSNDKPLADELLIEYEELKNDTFIDNVKEYHNFIWISLLILIIFFAIGTRKKHRKKKKR